MPVSLDRYNSWGAGMQRRYRRRYGSAPAASPAASPTPSPPVPPVDPILQGTLGQIGAQTNNTLLDLTVDEQRHRQDFGFDDASDPFNRARMLQRSFDIARRGTTNSMASQGQLYSGAHQRAQNRNAFNYQHDLHQLHTEYDRGREGFARRRRDVGLRAEGQALDARNESITRALQNRPDPSTVPPVELNDPLPQPRPRTTTRRRRRRRR